MPADEASQGGALQPDEVVAGEVGDEVRGGEDGPAVDRLHPTTLAADRDSSPVRRRRPICQAMDRRPRASAEQGVDRPGEDLGVAVDIRCGRVG